MVWLRRLAVALAAVAVAALIASGPGTRLGLWQYPVAFWLLRVAAYAGIAAGVLSLVALAVPKARAGKLRWLAIALVAGAAAAAVPLNFLRQARSVPPINDISTDLQNAAFAEQQKQAYPDVQPLRLPSSPRASFEKALAAAQAMGWDITQQDPAAGSIEAVDTTRWFGFKDDIAVRVSPEGAGSRVDVRSKSRVGRSDLGTNARRIRSYFERLK